MKKTIVLMTLLLASASASADYPLANITNNTDYPISGAVEYASAFCKNDSYSVQPGQTWTASGRGVCLITGISGTATGPAKHGESIDVVRYDSTGTSYGTFLIKPYGGQYRIFSDHEFDKVSKDQQGKSPGFRLVNKTDWPIAYSLEQVACLYHDVLPSRYNGKDGVRTISTGSAWFTLRVHIQPDGINPQTDMDCVEPVAEIVVDVLLGVAETVATGGAAAPAAAGQVVAKQVAKQAVKTAIKVSVKELSKQMAQKVGEYLTEAGTATMMGQFSGYEWPFRCDTMPEYEISGGPGLARTEDGSVYLTPGTPFKVAKVNSCGNDMMPASPLQTTASPTLDFPNMADAPAAAGGAPAASSSGDEQFVRIENLWHAGEAINIESGRPQCTATEPGWLSAQWTLERVGEGDYVRLKNRWKDTYLNNQNGSLDVGPIEAGWWSAQWTVEPLADGLSRIKNRWTGDYLNVEHGGLELGKIETGWNSAMWKVK